MLQTLMYRILHGLALSHLPTTISFPLPSPPLQPHWPSQGFPVALLLILKALILNC